MAVNDKIQIGCEAVAKAPVLSVVMLSFNQERFIRVAIESILRQKIDIPYELIIADDCSTDRTRDICIEFQAKYPDTVHLILRETNVGVLKNAVETLKKPKGKYIAFCEGDDFWIDPHKLQRQYELLESSPHITGVHTRVNYCDLEGQTIGASDLVPDAPGRLDFGYLLQKNAIHTCSFVIRKNVLDPIAFTVLEQSPIQDYTLFLLAALKGEVVYLPEVTAVYRKNAGVTAAWTFAGLIKDRLKIFNLLEKHFDLFKYRRSLYAAKQYQYFHLFSMPQKGWMNFSRFRYAASLIWYSCLTFCLEPDVKVHKISIGEVFTLIFKSRFRLKNWRLYLKSQGQTER